MQLPTENKLAESQFDATVQLTSENKLVDIRSGANDHCQGVANSPHTPELDTVKVLLDRLASYWYMVARHSHRLLRCHEITLETLATVLPPGLVPGISPTCETVDVRLQYHVTEVAIEQLQAAHSAHPVMFSAKRLQRTARGAIADLEGLCQRAGSFVDEVEDLNLQLMKAGLLGARDMAEQCKLECRAYFGMNG